MNLSKNYRQIEQQLGDLCQKENGKAKVLILPVSKRKPASDIRTLYDIGVRHFAENYLQEAQQKMDELSDCTEIQWHYIGKIQSKKCKYLAKQMAWVHTLDSLKQAILLDQHAEKSHRVKPLNVCIQVNLHQEKQKNGLSPNEITTFAQQIAIFPHLCLRGLMLIGQFGLTESQQIDAFKHMQKLFSMTQQRLKVIENGEAMVDSFDTLSMGMSDDWQNAVANGATIIRLGTTIFGARE